MGSQISIAGVQRSSEFTGSISLPWWGFEGATSWFGAGPTGVAMVVPLAGTFNNLQVRLNVAAGGVTTRTITLYKNGVAQSLVCAMGSAGTNVSDTTHKVTVAAGDLIELRHTQTGAPAATAAQFSVQFNPTSTTQQVLFFGNRLNSLQSTYMFIAGGNTTNASLTENDFRFIAPFAGTINDMYVHTNGGTTGGAGVGVTMQWRKNSANVGSTLVCNNGTDFSITGLGISFAQGDLLDIFNTRNGAPPERTFGIAVVYTPTTPGMVMFGANMVGALPGGTVYSALSGAPTGWNAASGTDKACSGPAPWFLSRMSQWGETSPSAAPSAAERDMTVYTEGVGALTASAQLIGTAVKAHDNTHVDKITAGQYLAMRTTQSGGSRSTARACWSAAQVVPAGGRLRTLMGVGL